MLCNPVPSGLYIELVWLLVTHKFIENVAGIFSHPQGTCPGGPANVEQDNGIPVSCCCHPPGQVPLGIYT